MTKKRRDATKEFVSSVPRSSMIKRSQTRIILLVRTSGFAAVENCSSKEYRRDQVLKIQDGKRAVESFFGNAVRKKSFSDSGIAVNEEIVVFASDCRRKSLCAHVGFLSHFTCCFPVVSFFILSEYQSNEKRLKFSFRRIPSSP